MCNNKIMSGENLIKNITSKDINLSINTLKTLINSENIEQYRELCEKADFIFPFLKERIIKDFVKLVNKENLKTIFKFSSIHCSDFEDLIVNSWTKFACEDLTDEILELFENGTNEQKTHCAKYFSYIQDSLALEYLNKYAKSDYEPLKINCAQALSAFKNTEILDEMKNIILNSNDDFEKLNAFSFIIAYGGEEQIKFVFEYAFSSPFLTNIISSILDYNDINYLKTILNNETLTQILNIIINEYPEEIELNTILYWNILEFLKLIYSFKNQYSNNILLIAKKKFNEFNQNDIYTFDLDKNSKNEIKNISNYLNSLDLDYSNLSDELTKFNNKLQYKTAINVIKEYSLKEYTNILANLINNKTINCEQMAETAYILKKLNSINLIDINKIEEIENQNIKTLIKSYF